MKRWALFVTFLACAAAVVVLRRDAEEMTEELRFQS